MSDKQQVNQYINSVYNWKVLFDVLGQVMLEMASSEPDFEITGEGVEAMFEGVMKYQDTHDEPLRNVYRFKTDTHTLEITVQAKVFERI